LKRLALKIISIRNLIQFYQKYPNARSSLETMISIIKHANWFKALGLAEDFPDADRVKNSR
jgi:mRNA interferase HigB